MTPEQRHEIILRSQQGQSIRAIARDLQMSQRTVSKALREQARTRSSENSADTPVSRRKWTILSTQSILHLKVDGASICSATSSAIHDDSICDLSTT